LPALPSLVFVPDLPRLGLDTIEAQSGTSAKRQDINLLVPMPPQEFPPLSFVFP